MTEQLALPQTSLSPWKSQLHLLVPQFHYFPPQLHCDMADRLKLYLFKVYNVMFKTSLKISLRDIRFVFVFVFF